MVFRLFIVFFCFSSALAFGREMVDISQEDFEGKALGFKTYYHRGDLDLTAADEEALDAKFQLGDRKIISFGHDREVYWYRISFYNPGSKKKRIYLHDSLNFTKLFQVYINKKAYRQLKQSKTLTERIIKIDLPPGEITDIYLKRQTEYTQRMSWNFWSSIVNLKSKVASLERNYYIVATVFAMSLLFNSMLYLSYRSRVYVYYNIYIFSMAMLATWMWSIVYYPTLTDMGGNIWGTIAQTCICLFTIEFLGIKEHAKKSYNVLKFCVYGMIGVFLINFFDIHLSSKYLENFSIFVSLCCIVSSITVYLKTRESHVLIYLVAFGIMLTSIIVQVLIWLGHIKFISNYILFFGSAVENILMLMALGVKIFRTEKERILSHINMRHAHRQLQHSYDQLAKVFYPHQLEQIREGNNIEETMPVHESEGCVICFDIIRSSTISPKEAKIFLRHVFIRCNAIMMENYDSKSLRANAFRVKEMGDGFLCSVGYPFKNVSSNIAEDAIELSLKFNEALKEECKNLKLERNISCAIGVAVGKLQGFFPESGTREYDLFGRALTLATRYESLRKILFRGVDTGSILLLQKQVYDQLSFDKKAEFEEIDLASQKIQIQDDESAKIAYIRYMDQAQQMSDDQTLEESA